MPLEHAPRCTHIKVNGHPCQSPALKGKNFCYFHHRMLGGLASSLNPRIHPSFILEDHESIQYAIMEVISLIALRRIEQNTASLLLRALNIAERNSRRTSFHKNPRTMVREIPTQVDPIQEQDVPAPPQPELSPQS